jgi:hypothetical protein
MDNFESGGADSDLLARLGVSRSAMYKRRRSTERMLGEALPTFKVGQLKKDGIKFGFNALRGDSPAHDMTHTVPDPFFVKGVSSYYNKDGALSGQWVKSGMDPIARERMLIAARDAFGEEIPRVVPMPYPLEIGPPELLNNYIVTDYHLGMLSWGEETGADWDIKIAESLLFAWFERAVVVAPPAATAILTEMGDFLHWDGLEAVTPLHKNILDADTRFQKLVRVAIRVLRRIVQLLLTKHEHVHLIFAEGNHDPASSIWLREWFAVLFEDEPRVTVDLNPDPYYCYVHGKTALFYHHGHLRKPGSVDAVLVGKFKDEYGKAKYHYAHTGHRHSSEVIETSLMLVEQHRTLAARDAYANRGGWLSGRDAQVVTYHTEYGEVGRTRISPEMVQGLTHIHKRKVPRTRKKARA